MAGTTTNGIPYPTGTDNNDTAAAMQTLAEFIDSRIWTPGDIRVTVSSATPTGWLAFGQTIVGGQSTYPNLWAVLPASYKSGSNIVLPDPSDAQISAVLSGPGAVSGSNTTALSVTQIPSHAHSIATHNHPLDHAHTVTNDSHTHGLVAATVTGDGSHSHTGNGNGLVYWDTAYNTGQSSTTPVGPNAPWALSWQPTIGGGSHSHDVGGSTDNDTHGHTVNAPTGTMAQGGPTTTGSWGTGSPSGTAFSIEGKKLQVRLLIKT